MRKKKEKQPGAWMSVEEVAGVMNVSRDTVARLVTSGSLPAVLIHSGKRKRTYRVRQESFEAWATAKEKSHEEGTPMRRPKLRIRANGSNILRQFQNGDRAPTEAGKSLSISTQFIEGA